MPLRSGDILNARTGNHASLTRFIKESYAESILQHQRNGRNAGPDSERHSRPPVTKKLLSRTTAHSFGPTPGLAGRSDRNLGTPTIRSGPHQNDQPGAGTAPNRPADQSGAQSPQTQAGP